MGRALMTVTSPASAVFVIVNPSSAARVDGVGDEAERRLHSRVLVRSDGGDSHLVTCQGPYMLCRPEALFNASYAPQIRKSRLKLPHGCLYSRR